MKITLNDVGSLIDATTAKNTINANNAVLKTAFENTLSRDGTTPNQMVNTFDLNGQQIINLPVPATTNSPLRLQDLNSFIGGGTISNIPTGGTTGQALKKNSNTNYDTGWASDVSSVGLALPTDFTVTNSPVTTSGVLNGAWTIAPTGTGAVVRAVSPTITGHPTVEGITSNGATGTGKFVFDTTPTLVAPLLGTPTSVVLTNATGTATGLTAGNATLASTVTTNANLTGPITSVGNATSIASQTGTGTKFVVDTSPTLVTPNIGVATATSVNKVTITAPATSAILTIANGKTLASNNSLTLAGTDATTLTFQGTDTYVGRATTDTLTNKTYAVTGVGNSLLLPYFSASLSAAQATTTTTNTKVACNTELADPNNWYDNATNFRFTPQLAGKYRITGHVSGSGTSLTEIDAMLFFNGSQHTTSFNVSNGVSALSLAVSKIMAFNGSTDFVEFFAALFGTGSLNFLGGTGPIRTWFEAQYIGA